MIRVVSVLWAAILLVSPALTTADQATYIYDDLGRLSQVIDGQGNVATYTYDAVGNLLSITRNTGGVGAPTITAITPSAGSAGTTVTVSLTGTNLTGAALATDNPGILVRNVVTTPTSISASFVIAFSARAGATALTVTTSTGSAAASFSVNASAPVLSAVSPTSGPVTRMVTITGNGFSSTAGLNQIRFNGVSATTLSPSATTLTTQVPSGATTGPITVTVGGLTSNGMNFTVTNAGPPPTLSSVSPNVGSMQGGQQTTLIGTNFVTGTTVKIGNKPASVLTLVSATTMIVQVPASVPGPADVVVTNTNGDALIQGGYTYLAGPSEKLGTITPAMGLINIPRNTPVTVSFSRPVDPTSITTSTFAFTQGTTPVAGSFLFSFGNSVVTLQPAATLAATTAYTLSLTQGIKSLDGVPLDGPFFGSFTTGTGTDTVPPTVTISPANGATNVPYNTTILLTFSKPINPNTVNPSTVLVTSQGQPVAGTITFGQQNTFAVFTPAAPFFPTSSVTVTVTGQVTDVAGNALLGAGGVGTSVTGTFTTGSTADRLPPIVLQTVPASGATGISVNTSLSVTFSKSVNPLTITPTTVQVTSSGTPIAGTFAFANFNQIITFLPAAPLPPVATITVTISNVADVVGNVMVRPVTSSFQTQSAIDNVRPSVVRTNPGAFPFQNPWPTNTNLPLNFKPMLAFDKRMNPSTINSTTFALSLTGQGTIPATITVAPDGQSAILTPTQLLLPNTLYSVSYTSGLQDLVGNPLFNPGGLTFTTGPVATDLTPPTVLDVSPRTGTQTLPINATVTVLFSEPVSFTSITPQTVVLSSGGVPVNTQLTLEQNNTVLRIKPANLLMLQANKFYELTVTSGVLDLAGNPLAASFSSSFTTGSTTDTTAPTVTAFAPAFNATGISRQTTITATFSKPINPITVTPTTFTVGTVTGTLAVSSDLKTVTFTPTNPLFAGTGYSVFINGVEDLTGNRGTGSSGFTTALAPGTIAANLPTAATGTSNPATLYSDGQTTTVITVSNISYQPSLTAPVTLVPNGTVIGLLPFDSNATFTGGGTILDGTQSQADVRVKLFTTLGGAVTATYQSPNAPLPLINGGGVNILSVDAAGAPVAVIGTARVNFVRGTSFLPTVNPSALLANSSSSTGQMSVIVRNPSGTSVPAGESVAVTFEPVFPPVNATSIGGGTINGGTVAPDPRFRLFTTTAGGRVDFTYTPPTLATGQSAVSALQMANVDASGNLVSQIRTSDGFNDRFFLNGSSGFSGPQPTLLAVSPANGESGVGTNATIDLLFSESLDPTTVNATTVSVTSGGTIPGTYTLLASAVGPNTLVRFTPTTPFAPSTTFTVAITVGIKNPAGIPLLSAGSVTFSTGTGPDTTPPTVVQLLPSDQSSGVATNRLITVQFSEPMNATTLTTATFTVSAGGSPISGRVTVSAGFAGPNSVATFTPMQPLAPTASYTVSLSGAILDMALNPLPAMSAAFTSGSGADTVQPSVLTTSPRLVQDPRDTTISLVPLDAKVSVQFSEPMNPLTLTAATIQLQQTAIGIPGTTVVAGTLAIAPDLRSVTFTPAQPLIPNGLFSLSLSSAITDLAGNPLLANFNTYFQTGVAPTDATLLAVTSSPVTGDTGIALNAPVVLQFSKAIAPTTITNATVTVTSASGPLPGTFSIEQNNHVVRWLPANLVQLSPNTLYTVTVSTGVTDLEGRPMAAAASATFTTGSGTDTTPPTVVASVPVNNATGIGRSTTIQVTLNKPIDPATAVLGATVFLNGPGAVGPPYTSTVPAALAVSADRRTVTLTPTNLLVANQLYSVTLSGVEDLAGNKMSNTSAMNFTTAMAAGTVLATLPYQATVTANPTTLFADGVQSTTIIVTNVSLSAGALVPNGTTVAVTALPALDGSSAGGVILGGTPSPTDARFMLFTTQGGGFTLTYVAPNRPDLVSGGTGVIQVAPVDVAGTPVSGTGGVVIGRGTVTLVRGTLVTAAFNPTTLLANGTSTAAVTLTLQSPSTGAPTTAGVQLALTVAPVFTASAGGTLTGGTPATDPRFSIFTTLPNGEIDLTYTAPVLASGTATAVFQAAAVDAGGNILQEVPFQSFAGQLALSATAGFTAPQPVVVALSPAHSETNVGTNAVVMAKFSQPLNPATVTPSTFSVGSGGALAGTLTVTASELGPNTLVIWTPSTPLRANSSVTVSITSGVQNTAGEPLLLNSLSSATFSTGSGPDTTAPTVVQVNPPNGVLSVGTNSVITIEFSEPINATTATPATISVTTGGVPIPGRVTVAAGPRGPNTRVVFTPSQLLGATLSYTLTVSTGITDTARNPLAAPYTASFGTGTGIDNFQPSVVSVSPQAGMIGVPLNAPVIARFSEPINPLTLNATTYMVTSFPYGTVPGTITVAPDLLSATFTPAALLLPNTSYSISLSTNPANAIQDLAGNPLLNPGALVGSFTTGSGPPDTVNPQVLLVSPATASTAVPLNGEVLLEFSKPLAATSVTAQSVTVSAGGVPVVGLLTLEQNDTVVRWRVANLAQLAPTTAYTVTVTTGVTDVAGNRLAAPFTSTFTTGTSADTTPPSVLSVTPAAGATNVARTTVVTVTFNKAIDPATVIVLDPVLNGGTYGTFSLTNPYTSFSFVPGTIQISPDRTMLTFTPTFPLLANQTYNVSVANVEDPAGNKGGTSTSFTTAMAAGTNLTALPTSAVVTANPAQLFADGQTSATVTITNIARNGILVPNGTVVAVSADPSLFEVGAGGTILGGVPSSQDPRFQLFTTVNGTVTLTYQSPNRPDLFNGGRAYLWVASVDAADAPISSLGNTSITLTRGTFATFDTNPASLLANGTSYSTVSISLTDSVSGVMVPVPAGVTYAVTTAPVFSTNSVIGTLSGGTVAPDSRFVLFPTVPGGTITGTYTAPVLAAGQAATSVMQLAKVDGAGNILSPFSTTSVATISLNGSSGPTSPQPTVVALSPANGQTGVGTNATVAAKFSLPVNRASVTFAANGSFSVTQGGVLVPGSVSFSASELGPDTMVTFTPAVPFPVNASVSVNLTAGIQSVTGQALRTAASSTFSIGLQADTVAPTVTLTNPVAGSGAVPTNSFVSAAFSEPINTTTVNPTTVSVTTGGAPVAGRFTFADGPAGKRSIVTFMPNQLLAPNTTYLLSIGAGLTDTAGNGVIPATVTFTTSGGIDNVQPTMLSSVPTSGATGFPATGTPITITLSEPANPLTVNGTTVFFYGAAIPATVTLSNNNTVITVTPNQPLFAGTQYSVIAQGVQDVAGNPLTNVSVSFTTALAPGTTNLPTSATVTVNPPQLFANGLTTSQVTISNIKNGGTLVSNGTLVAVTAAPAMAASLGGTISGPSVGTSVDGRFLLFQTLGAQVVVTYTTPNLGLTDSGASGQALVQVASVDLDTRPVSLIGSGSVSLFGANSTIGSATPSTLSANGTATAALTVTVRDGAGNLVPDGTRIGLTAAPVFSPSVGGTILGGTPSAVDPRIQVFTTVGGQVTATYQATTTPGTVVIQGAAVDGNGLALRNLGQFVITLQ